MGLTGRIASALLLSLLPFTPAVAGGEPVRLVSGEETTSFDRLSNALAKARPGDRVVLDGGEHRGAFVLPAGVTLEGPGTLIQVGDRPGLSSTGASGAVTGVTFRSAAGRGKSGPGRGTLLDVTGGSIVVTDCRFLGYAGVGISVREPAKARIERCVVDRCGPYGIHLIGDSEMTVRRCRVSRSTMMGIRLDGTKARIERTVVRGSARTGVYIAGPDDATIEHCHFADNGHEGVGIPGRATTRIVANSFVRNLRSAIGIDLRSSPEVRENVLVDNSVGVWLGQTTGNPDVYPLGRPRVADNALCGNGFDYRGFLTDPPGRRSDREFVDPERGDYRPTPGSRLLREGFGRADAGLGDPAGLPSPVTAEPVDVPTGTATGRLLDENGEGVPNAMVVLDRRPLQRVAWTRPDGTFEFLAVPEGPWRARANAVGHLMACWPRDILIRAGETTRLPDLSLARDHPISGFLGDGRGGAVPGGVAWAVDLEEPHSFMARRGVARWSGKFRVGNVPSGRRILLAFRRQAVDSELCVLHVRPEVEAGSRDVRLVHGVERVVLHIGDDVGGKADDLDLAVWGTPAVGGELLLARWERPVNLHDLKWPAKFTGRVLDVPIQLPPGRYDFVLRRTEHRRIARVATALGVEVRPEESRRVDLVTKRAGRIEGKVVDKDGGPVAGARIESAEIGPTPTLFGVLDRDPPRLYRTFSDENGKFRIGAVEPGDRRLRVVRGGFADQVVTVPGVAGRKVVQIRVVMGR